MGLESESDVYKCLLSIYNNADKSSGRIKLNTFEEALAYANTTDKAERKYILYILDECALQDTGVKLVDDFFKFFTLLLFTKHPEKRFIYEIIKLSLED